MLDAQKNAQDPARTQQNLIDSALRQIEAVRSQIGQPPDSLREALAAYHILGEIHRGGQGVVYRAIQRSTGRDVAIKVIHNDAFGSETNRPRFEREVHVLSRLRHPHIVTLHDSGLAGGEAYFVMDYIPGLPLDRWVAGPTGWPPLRQRLELFATICEAVNAAHLRGFIHRDLKPGNILVDAEGRPHLLDFGLAKLILDDSTDGQSMTQTGQFVGSLPWASPEQAEGRLDQVDLRTDVYSLGVLLYQLLTNTFPYSVTDGIRQTVENIVHAAPKPPSRLEREVDEELETIVLKCLQKDRERRYQSAGEVARELRRYLAGEPVEAKRDSRLYIIRKQLRRHRVPITIGSAFVLLLVASSVVAWSLYVQAERARAVATQRLWDSYLVQAQAGAASRVVGRRFESLRALQRAAEIRPALALRDEAIACLLLSDLRREAVIEAAPGASTVGLHTLDRYAVGRGGGSIEVRRIPGDSVLATLEGPQAAAVNTFFSSDGRYLAARFFRSDSSELWVWDLESSQCVFRCDSGECRVDGAAFGRSEGQAWIAVTARPAGIDIYGLPGGEKLRTVPVGETMTFIAVDDAGRRIATAGYGQETVDVWDIAAGRLLHSLPVEAGGVTPAFSRDGRLLACPSYDRNVYVWETDAGELVQQLAGHQGAAIEAYFNPDATLLASWAWDGTTRLWDLRSGKQIFDPIQESRATGFADVLAIRSEERGRLELWSFVERSPCLEIVADEPMDVLASGDVNQDATLIATAGENGVRLWDGKTGRELAVLLEEPAEEALLLPGDRVLVASAASGLWRWTLEKTADGVRAGPGENIWRDARLRTMTLSPDGRSVVAIGPQLLRIDVQSGETIASLDSYRGMERPSLTPDGRLVFTGNWRGQAARVRRWDTGETVWSLDEDSVRGAFSPDGRWLLIGTGAAHTLLDTRTWKPALVLPRRHRESRAAGPCFFSPDSRMAAVMHSRYSVRLVEIPTGRALATLPNPKLLGVMQLAFSDDGSHLAVISTDRSVLLWNLDELQRELRQIGLAWQRSGEGRSE